MFPFFFKQKKNMNSLDDVSFYDIIVLILSTILFFFLHKSFTQLFQYICIYLVFGLFFFVHVIYVRSFVLSPLFPSIYVSLLFVVVVGFVFVSSDCFTFAVVSFRLFAIILQFCITKYNIIISCKSQWSILHFFFQYLFNWFLLFLLSIRGMCINKNINRKCNENYDKKKCKISLFFFLLLFHSFKCTTLITNTSAFVAYL